MARVKCVTGVKGQLTKGEQYRVITKQKDRVFVKTDRGTFGWFNKKRFESDG